MTCAAFESSRPPTKTACGRAAATRSASAAYEFDIQVTGHERIAVTDVLAADGTLLQTVFNIGLSETDSNSVSGETLGLKGAIHEVWDYAPTPAPSAGRCGRRPFPAKAR